MSVIARWSSQGVDCAKELILLFRKPLYQNPVFIAHNAKGYDSYLLLNAVIELGLYPILIMQERKICLFHRYRLQK